MICDSALLYWPQHQITKSSVSFLRKVFQCPPSLPIPGLVPGQALSLFPINTPPPSNSLQTSARNFSKPEIASWVCPPLSPHLWTALWSIQGGVTPLSLEFKALQGPVPFSLSYQMSSNASWPMLQLCELQTLGYLFNYSLQPPQIPPVYFKPKFKFLPLQNEISLTIPSHLSGICLYRVTCTDSL